MKVTNLVNVDNIIKYVCSYGERWQILFCDISQIFVSHQDHSSTFQSIIDLYSCEVGMDMTKTKNVMKNCCSAKISCHKSFMKKDLKLYNSWKNIHNNHNAIKYHVEIINCK
jgi:hypothetical protein